MPEQFNSSEKPKEEIPEKATEEDQKEVAEKDKESKKSEPPHYRGFRRMKSLDWLRHPKQE